MVTSKELKHNILMIENAPGDGRCQYPNVVDTYTEDGKIVLCMDNGDKQMFPASNWSMYDFSPTLGWNKVAAAQPAQLSGKHQIHINLIRRRDCEGEFWVDNLFLVVDDGTYKAVDFSKPGTAEAFLRKIAENYLSTPGGWAENCEACKDYNWGDFVMSLSLPACGAVLSCDRDKFIEIDNVADIMVNQDEHLAPIDVEAKVFTGDPLLSHITAMVDFRDGTVELDSPEDVPACINMITVRVRAEDFVAIRKASPLDGWELEEL